MNSTATITSKKQLTLPAALFRKAGLKVGQKVIVSEKNGYLLITPAEKLVEELAGSVSVPQYLQNTDIDKIIEEAKNRYFSQNKK